MKTLPKLFINKVDFSGECWIWTGAKNSGGYGNYRSAGKTVSAHRFIYEHLNGPILNGLFVCHKCDIRNCVNPSHLFLGTNQDNVDDMVLKGRYNCVNGEQHGRAKLTKRQVDEIRRAYIRGSHSEFNVLGLSKKYEVSITQISFILNNKSWVS